MFNAIGLHASDTTIIQRVLWKGGFHAFPSLYRHITDFSALPVIPSCGPTYSSASGFMGSLGLDFQYEFKNSPWSVQSRLYVKGIPEVFYEKE
jgi:hypothetical protein